MKRAQSIDLERTPVHSLHEAVRVMLRDASIPARADNGSVHAARKEMKRIRAGLRLLRAVLGDTAYRRQNTLVRDAAKPLTPVRDAAVLLQALDALRKTEGPSECKDYLRRLRGLLQEDLRSRRAELAARAARDTAAALRESAKRLEALPARAPEPLAVRQGIERIYKRGRTEMRHARRRRDDACLHEWRKQVKYLSNGVELGEKVYLGEWDKLRKRSHKLADLLGDDHDLAVLSERIRFFQNRRLLPSTGADRTIQSRIKARRRKLQKKAFPLGKRLYGKSKRRLERTINLALLTADA